MTTLLERIDSSLGLNPTPQERAELLGEKACYLARAGDAVGADAVVRVMREEWGAGHYPRAMVWIMLAEGLVGYFSNSPDKAWDRVRRAWLISVSVGMPRLEALTSVWMAHLEFYRSRYNEMREYLAGAFGAGYQRYSDVQLRFALVIADCASNCGRSDRARHWRGVAHKLAVSCGDRLALAALMYNRAVHGLNCLVVNGIVGDERPADEDLAQFALELESVRQFEAIIGVSTFWQALNLTRGIYFLIVNDDAAAAAVFHELRLQELQEPLSQLVAAYAAVSDLRAGAHAHASSSLDNFLIEKSELSLDADELVLITSAYKEVASGLGRVQDLQSVSRSLEAAKRKYLDLRTTLRHAVEEFIDVNIEDKL